MKWQVTVALMAILAITYADDDHYTDKYDGINVQEILENKVLTGNYVKCMLDKGPCTAEGKELKAHLKDAIQTGCKKCTPKQKEGAKLVIEHLKTKEPQYWEDLKAKYDPNNEYEENYEKILSE